MSLAYDIACALSDGRPERNSDGFVCRCPSHDDNSPSMSIKDDGDGDVKVFCHVGCDYKEIKDELRRRGLLPEWVPKESKNHASKNKRETIPNFIWNKPQVDGASEYIRTYFKTREIFFDEIPLCFKFNPYNNKAAGETEHYIVAAVSEPADKKVNTIHRLLIDINDGCRKLQKWKLLGEPKGRGVWFDRKGLMETLIVGEGIETTLSAMQAMGMNGVSAISANGMESIVLPSETQTIYILVDSDTVKEKQSMRGQHAAYALATRFTEERNGNRAFLVSPDDTCFSDAPVYLDFNDLLKEDPSGESIRKRFTVAQTLDELEWRPKEQKQSPESSSKKNNGGAYPGETLEALVRMNEKYAAVILGSDFRIAKEGYDTEDKQHTIDFLKTTALYSYYANQKVRVYVDEHKNTELLELAKVWMSWPERRTYDGVVFDPSEKCGAEAYNLYKGFAVRPESGDWSKMREHIFKILCLENPEHFAYIMSWMARIVQDPGGDRPGVAIVLKGGKGVGKGLFANYFGTIFGGAFLPVSDQNSITGRFNMHFSKCLLAFFDESVWGGDKRAEGKLKALVTEPTIMFEPKGIDSIAMKSFLNIIIASNEDWVVPATGDERRWFVLNPSSARQKDTDYFNAIVAEMRTGGPAAMMYDLLHWDCSQVDLRKAPFTEGLIEQVQISLKPVEQFWHGIFSREFMLSDKDTGGPLASAYDTTAQNNAAWPTAAFKYEIHSEYLNWCRRQNVKYPDDETRFWSETWNFWHGGRQKRMQKRDDGVLKDVILLPELNDAKASFTSATKVVFDHTDVTIEDQEYVPFNNQF